MFKRFVTCIFNILFPPLAVFMLAGLNQDVFFNCILFLLAVIPSHIHGFYISLTYFNRKRKVRKGIYPGKPHSLIYSSKVNNGGASRREIEIMRKEKETGRLSKRLSERLSRRTSGKAEDWDDGSEECYESSLSRQSSRRNDRRSQRRSERYGGQDGYEVEQVPSRHSSRRWM